MNVISLDNTGKFDVFCKFKLSATCILPFKFSLNNVEKLINMNV